MFFEQADFVVIDQIAITVVEFGNKLDRTLLISSFATLGLSDFKT